MRKLIGATLISVMAVMAAGSAVASSTGAKGSRLPKGPGSVVLPEITLPSPIPLRAPVAISVSVAVDTDSGTVQSRATHVFAGHEFGELRAFNLENWTYPVGMASDDDVARALVGGSSGYNQSGQEGFAVAIRDVPQVDDKQVVEIRIGAQRRFKGASRDGAASLHIMRQTVSIPLGAVGVPVEAAYSIVGPDSQVSPIRLTITRVPF